MQCEMRLKLERNIVDAIEEARILECARESYDVNNVLRVAQRLSGASMILVKKVYDDLLTIA